PYTYFLLPHTDQYENTTGTDGFTGISQSVFTSFKSRMGTFGIRGTADLSVEWSDRAKEVAVDGLDPKVAEEAGYEGYESGGRFIMSEKQNEPAYASRYEIAGSWPPRRMKSFSVELLTGALRRFDPYYIYAPAATVDGVEVV